MCTAWRMHCTRTCACMHMHAHALQVRLWDARQPRAAASLPSHNGRCVLSLAWLPPWGGAPPPPAPRAAVLVPRSLMELDALLEPHEAWRDEAPRTHASEGRRLGEALGGKSRPLPRDCQVWSRCARGVPALAGAYTPVGRPQAAGGGVWRLSWRPLCLGCGCSYHPPGEALLVSGDVDGALRFFDLRSMRCQGGLLTTDGAAHALHAAHGLVFAAAAGGGVDGFDARLGFQELAGRVCEHTQPAWALASDAAGSFLFSAAADGPVLRHALPSFRALSPLEAHPFGTCALAAVEDAHGRVLLASGGFKDCEVWVRVVSGQEAVT